eukprot:CAMPEP_0174322582 /NCGR_PEP_ID=MMETSP0810-20121108/11096_1 /TAXON_ID=73025 ORGANISM="Eutreptiella gymnastica-like, Strain CCMP1594" /NCGR_SAMPLE_ID=MMETSP0810 /ASSEMBLY_ACC=CAM_ASM_000659 /LENGTH=124 /DNA_ID=CAMNT_0015434443 /DNA_START=3763 /DNA_END=4132 /DNA_ORIENTATION=+
MVHVMQNLPGQGPAGPAAVASKPPAADLPPAARAPPMPTNHMAGQSTARYMSTRVRDTGHTLLYSARLACITCMSATQRTSGICSAGLGTESRCCLAIHRLWGLFTQPLHRYEMRIALQKEGLG